MIKTNFLNSSAVINIGLNTDNYSSFKPPIVRSEIESLHQKKTLQLCRNLQKLSDSLFFHYGNDKCYWSVRPSALYTIYTHINFDSTSIQCKISSTFIITIHHRLFYYARIESFQNSVVMARIFSIYSGEQILKVRSGNTTKLI